MVQYKYNSADNHLDQRWIPGDLWQSRMDAKFREAGPKLVDTDDGLMWSWEGKIWGGRDGGTADGPDNAKILEEFYGPAGVTVEPGKLPPADPALILEHMDLAGIYAYVGYGSVRKWQIENYDLRMEVHRVYNDWVMELNQPDPDRLLMLPHLPTWDVDACAGEIDRMAKLGCKAVEFPVFDISEEIWHEAWEPTWAAASEAGIVLCSHIGDKAGAPYAQIDRGVRMAHFSTVPFVAAKPIAQMTYAGVFQRHPNLKYNYGECRAGWAPFLLQWMDRQAEERPGLFKDSGLELMPSDYVKRQVTITFEEDYIAGMMLQHEESMLADILMWGADYPHPQGIWPEVGPVVDKIFKGVDDAVKQDVVWNRCLEVFNLDGPAPEQRAAA